MDELRRDVYGYFCRIACEIHHKHKEQAPAMIFFALEAISLQLDEYGKGKLGFVIAAFILSASSFTAVAYAYIKDRKTGATRSRTDKKLKLVEVVFSIIQLVVTFYDFIKTVLRLKTGYTFPNVFPLAFSLILVIYAFKDKGKGSDNFSHNSPDGVLIGRTSTHEDRYANNKPHKRFQPKRPDATSSPHVLPRTVAVSLPRHVAVSLHQGSTVTSMDFHPSRPTLLLVGSSNGEITLWELSRHEKLITKSFRIWNSAQDVPGMSVCRVAWSPNGTYVGVAFTRHWIQLYSFAGSRDLRQHLQISAHDGGLKDLAFAHPGKQLCVVTCGDGEEIRVWDLNGKRLHNLEPPCELVYSICPHNIDNIQFIFSSVTDRNTKVSLYDSLDSRVDYDAPGLFCITILYSAKGTRLFSCGTSEDGNSYVFEWNEKDGALEKAYAVLRKKSDAVVTFDATQYDVLIEGTNSQIRFWDSGNVDILASTDADGKLPRFPRLRCSKDANLLAVSTEDNGFMILANPIGLRLLGMVGNNLPS